LVPGGPRKSVVSCGNGRCVVGCTLLGAERELDGVDGLVALGFGGGGGGGTLGGGIGDGTIAGDSAGGAGNGMCVAGGATGIALVGGGRCAVVVGIGTVGSTTPVSLNGWRDTTVMAGTRMASAATARAHTTTDPKHGVWKGRSRLGALLSPVRS
jgi:hypothetical protein